MDFGLEFNGLVKMKIVNKQRLFNTPRIKLFLSKFKFQSAGVTLKIKSRSPNSKKKKNKIPKIIKQDTQENKSVTDIKKLQRVITITVLIP